MQKKYNLWTVISEKKKRVGNRIYVVCKCDCGTIKNVMIKNLKSGRSKSCGCVGKKILISRSTVHNKRHTKIWRTWQAMKNRCSNKNMAQYKDYGGRGIKVCPEWKDSFLAFYKAVGEPPEGTSIDRIDNNGNYEPSNVKWSTPEEQGQNKRSNRKINGVCITRISKKLGGGHNLVAKRLKRGWSVEKACNTISHASL